MQERGNSVADLIYGSKRVAPEATKVEKQQFVSEKYKVDLAMQSLENLRAAPERLAKAHVVDQRESTARAGVTLVPTLLTSVSQKDALQPFAKTCDIPDNLFDELFDDWSTPVAPKVIAQKIEVPSTCFHEGARHESSVAASQQTLNVKTRSPWGALGDVDDIFADLNSIGMTMQ